jgi:hypothetical protein
VKRTSMRTRPRRRRSDWTALAGRSGGWCEMRLSGCQGRAVDPCHRIGSKAGGRQGAAAIHHDRLSNVIHGCRSCHDWTHQHRLPAEALGLILPEHADTLLRVVVYRGVPSLLDDEGGVSPADECEGAPNG